MTILDDKTLANYNSRLSKMDELLVKGVMSASDLGKGFTSAFSTTHIDAFISELAKIDRKKAIQVKGIFSMCDENGNPIDLKDIGERLKKLKTALKDSKNTSYSNREGDSFASRAAMEEQVRKWESIISLAKTYKLETKSIEQQYITLANALETVLNKRSEEKRRFDAEIGRSTTIEQTAIKKQKSLSIEWTKDVIKRRRIEKEISELEGKRGKKNREHLALKKKELELLNRQTKELRRQSDEIEKQYKGSRMQALRQTSTQRRMMINDAQLRDFNAGLRGARGGLSSLFPLMQRLGGMIGATFSIQTLTTFIKKVRDVRAEFEMQNVALRAILQNKQVADGIWDKTMNLALQSPYKALELVTYTKQLAAYRIESDKLFDTTKRLADISSGLGVDMQRLILAYGQVKAANFLRASEVRQFTEAGVNVYGELAHYFTELKGQLDELPNNALTKYLRNIQGETVSVANVIDMVTKRLVRFEEVEEIFKRITDEGGTFYNMQYIQSQTLKGQMNKLQDSYDLMMNSIGKTNERVLKGYVDALSDMLVNWRSVASVITGLASGAAIGVLTKKIGGLVKEHGGLKESISEIVSNLKDAKMTGWGWAGAAVGIIATVVTTLIQLNRHMKNHNKEVYEVSARYEEQIETLDDYNERIEKNNKAIKELGEKTERTAEEEETLNNAMKDNRSIVADLNRDYPNLMTNTELQKNGMVELSKAVADYNTQLQQQLILQNATAQKNIFNQDIVTDAKQFLDTHTDFMGELGRLKSEVRGVKVSGKYKKGGETLLQQILDYETRGNIGIDSYHLTQMINKFNRDYALRGNKVQRLSGLSERHITEFNKELASYMRENIWMLEENLIKQYGDKIGDKDARVWLKENYEIVEQDILDGVHDFAGSFREQFERWGFLDKESQKALLQKLGGWIGKFNIFTKAETKIGYNATAEEQADIEKATLDRYKKMIELIETMGKKYKESSENAYTYARAEEKVREAFQEAWSVTGLPFEMARFDIQKGEEGVRDALSLLAAFAPAKVMADLEKKIGEYTTKIEFEKESFKRSEFEKKMENMFDQYDITLKLKEIYAPQSVIDDLYGEITETSLPSLRGELATWYANEGETFSQKDFETYEKYLKKIEEIEDNLQKERIKKFIKYTEYELSERAKLSLEYHKNVAEVGMMTDNVGTKKRILEGLKEEYEKALAQLDWEDFKGSDYYVEMMEDLTRQSSKSLDIMKSQLMGIRANPENLSPRALKEVVNAIEKIEEIERERVNPFKRWAKSAKDLKMALKGRDMLDVYEELAELEEKRVKQQTELNKIQSKIGLSEEEMRLIRQVDETKDIGTLASELAELEEDLAEHRKKKPSETTKGDYQVWLNDENELIASINTQKELIEGIKLYQEVQERLGSNVDLESLLKQSDKLKTALGLTDSDISSLKEVVKIFDKHSKDIQDSLEEIKDWSNRVGGLYQSVFESLNAFGVQTNPLTEYWSNVGQEAVSSINEVVDAVKEYKEAMANREKAGFVSALFSGDTLKLAMAMLGVILKVVQSVANFKNAKIDKEIERQEEKVNNLAHAYERLQKAMEKAVDTASYFEKYEESTENLSRQIAATEAQLSVALGRKNRDAEEIRGLKQELDGLYDQKEELKNSMLETFGGVTDVRSFAEGFVSAWHSAFLETENGLDALKEHFDEFLNDWFMKQATMNIASKALGGLVEQINASISDDGVVDWDALEQIRNNFNTIAPQLAGRLENLFQMFDDTEEGVLSGLSEGIQGVSESTANVIEGYLNSMRHDVYTTNVNVASILDALTNPNTTNPMLEQMRLTAHNTSRIVSLLDAVSKGGHPNGGSGLKVFVN